MVGILVRNKGTGNYQLFYSSVGFMEGLTVTGYIIYPDKSKSDVLTFEELGDGVYVADVPYERQSKEVDDKYGVVVKENGKTRHFNIIRMIN